MSVRRLILRGGDIVTADAVISDGALVIEDGRIAEILYTTPSLAGDDVRWVAGLVAPAFVDLHSDALENEIRPRPSCAVPVDLALTELDRKLAGQGITTMFHSVAFAEDGGARFHREGERLAGAILHRAGACLIRHRLHARYDIADLEAAPTLERLIARERVHLLSFVDHAPGEGHRPEIGATASALASAAGRAAVPVGSQDDDSAGQIEWAHRLGASIAGFPVNPEAAEAARQWGLHVVMGAPDVVRGGSTGPHLSVLTALRKGCLDALCSAYCPASLLHAVVALYRRGICPLPAAFRLVSLHPARTVRLDRTLGSIEPGKLADVIVVGASGGLPVVTRTLREGREIFAADYGVQAQRLPLDLSAGSGPPALRPATTPAI